MRAWMILGLLSGCCADTYEIGADTTNQPVAQITLGSSTETGDLRMHDVTGGFVASLRTDSLGFFVLHVPDTASGTFSGELDLASETIPVAITATDVELTEVCMSPDQNDYGTGRCGFSFVGTIAFLGTSASAGAVSGTWIMNQIAVVRMGTPDC